MYKKFFKNIACYRFWQAMFVHVKRKKMDDIITGVKLALYAIFAWLGVKTEAFQILIILMCLDSIVGVIKALRMDREFKFSILLMGYILKLCFLIIPLVVALLGKSLGYDLRAIIHIVIAILSVAEAYSIFGNIYSAKNRVEVKKIDAISILLKSFRVMLLNLVNGLVKKLEKMAS